MLKKRGNENSQLRPEEVEALNNEDEEAGDLGTFKRASTEEIATRRIVKSKRISDKVLVPSNAPSALPSFPAFSTTSSFAASSNPFSNFTGLSQPPKSSIVSLSLPFTTTTTTAAAAAIEPPKSTQVSAERKTEVLTTTTTAAVPESSKQSEFNVKLKKLNSSFSQWVQRQMVEHPLSLWKDGLKDYIKYYDALVAKYGIDVTSENFIPDSPSESESSAAPVKPTIAAGVTPSLSLGQVIAPPKPVPISFNADASKSFGSNLFQSSSPVTTTTTTTTSTSTTESSSNKPSFFASAPPAFGTAAVPTTTTTTAAPTSLAPSSNAPAAAPLFSTSTAFSFPAAPTAANGTAAAVGATPALKFNFTGSNSFASSSMPSSFGSGGSGSIFSAFPTTSTTTFGGATAATAAPTSSFGFAPQATQPTEDGGDDGDDAGEPILEPEKAIRDVNDTDEILHEAPCKLYRYDKESKEWRDTGKGTFRITRSADTRKQRMLVRNIIGKIIFNASFYKEMTLIVQEGKTSGIKFSAVVAEEETVKDDKGVSSTRVKTEMKSFMLKFKPTDLAGAAEKMRAGVASVSG